MIGGDFLGRFTLIHTLERYFGRQSLLSPKPLGRAHSGFAADSGRIDVSLEDFCASRYNERDRLDIVVVDGLEGSCDFVVVGL